MVLEALCFVVDDDVGTERFRELDIGGADCREDSGALCLGELDREMTYAAGSAVDE